VEGRNVELIRCCRSQPTVITTVITTVTIQGRNHVFKVGGPIPWSRLLYRTKYGWHTQFRALQSAAKKLGLSVQILGGPDPLDPPSGCALGHLRADCLYTGITSGPNARYRVWESLYLYLYIKQEVTTHHSANTRMTYCTVIFTTNLATCLPGQVINLVCKLSVGVPAVQ